MFAIDPRRTDLALEFKWRPFGPHSPELQAVPNVLRGSLHCQNLQLVCTRPHAEWVLAEKQSGGRPPRLFHDLTFTSLEGAEWHAFRVRWEAVTGRPCRPSTASEKSWPGVSVSMPRVLGYADPPSVAAGEEIRFMVGTLDGPRRYRAEVVRLVCGDTGSGALRRVRLPTSEGEHAGTPQPIDAGSYAIVEHPEAFAGLMRFTPQAFIQPTRCRSSPLRGGKSLWARWVEDHDAGFALMLDEAGALALLVGGAVVSTGALTARVRSSHSSARSRRRPSAGGRRRPSARRPVGAGDRGVHHALARRAAIGSCT